MMVDPHPRTPRPHPSGHGALLALGLALGASLPASGADLVLSDMTWVGSEAGRRDVVLSAERARIEHGGDVARLDVVELDAAGDDGNPSLVLTADHADLHLSTSDFDARGNVRGHTADGHRFRTEHAVFDHDRQVIHGDAPVDIVDPVGTRLRGSGFRYDVRNRLMTMRDAVVSEVQDGEEAFQ
jgi:LPS export ABC transporter protein LptC